MKEPSSSRDRLDLFDIAEVILDGRLKVFGFIFFALLLGSIYNYYKQATFEVSTSVQNGKQSVFIDYTSINDVLKENALLLDNENVSGYKIDAPSVFQIFVSEFEDYEEMISVLERNKFVIEVIENESEESKRQILLNFAKLFQVNSPLRKEKNWRLMFTWHDVEEGVNLFEEALNLTLQSVKITLYNDINNLAKSIDLQTKRIVEKKLNELELVALTEIEKNKRRINFLTEQAAIARELGIQINSLDNSSLARSEPGFISVTIEAEVPYYLRGYKAIEKEISILKNRSPEIQLLMTPEYIEMQQEIFILENKPSSTQLILASKAIEKDDPSDWIRFEFGLAKINPLKNSIFYITISVLLGAIFGIVYVLISNAYYNRKLN